MTTQNLYVAIDYRDPHGHDHVRGDVVTGDPSDPVIREFLYRGILSVTAPRREAGANSSRVSTVKEDSGK